MEAGLDYDSKRLPSSEDYSKMLAVSPIVLADQVSNTRGNRRVHVLVGVAKWEWPCDYKHNDHKVTTS